jgi:hypothetical protein
VSKGRGRRRKKHIEVLQKIFYHKHVYPKKYVEPPQNCDIELKKCQPIAKKCKKKELS